MYFNHIKTIPDVFGGDEMLQTSAIQPNTHAHHSNFTTRPNPHNYPSKRFPNSPHILPHWGDYLHPEHFNQSAPTYTLNGQTHTLLPLDAIYSHDKLPLQISKALFDHTVVPSDATSALLQDQVRLGQSFLLPQTGVAPSQLGIARFQQALIHTQSTEQVLMQEAEELDETSLTTPSQTTQTSLAHAQSTIINSLTTFLHTYHLSAPDTAAKSPKNGFFYSDDSLIHSLLPHHSAAQLCASESAHHVSLTDAEGNLLPQSRFANPISSLPNTQQHLPDNFETHMKTGLTTTLNRHGEYPWVTPTILLTFDPLKRISLPLMYGSNDVIRRSFSRCHRFKLPKLLIMLCGCCIFKDLSVPTITPSRAFYSLQAQLLDVLLRYQKGLPTAPSTPTKEASTSEHSSNDLNNSSHLLTPLTFLTSIISSIRTAFTSTITIKRSTSSHTPPPPTPITHQALPLPPSSSDTRETYSPDSTDNTRQIFESQRIALDLAPYQAFNTPISKIIDYNEDYSRERLNEFAKTRPNPSPLYPTPYSPNPFPTPDVLKSITTDELRKSVEKRARANIIQTNAISQPLIPLFPPHATSMLFNYSTECVSIFPFSTSIIKDFVSSPLKFFRKAKLPSISVAQLFATCFPLCIMTPYNIINKMNKYALELASRNYSRIITRYHLIRAVDSDADQIPQPIFDDIQLQTNSTHFYYYSHGAMEDTFKLFATHFQSIANTPLLYKVSPLAMAFFLQFLHKSVEGIDQYFIFQALLRWTVYHTALKYQSHQNACPKYLEQKKNYTSILEYSIQQYQVAQNKYLTLLANWAQPSSSTAKFASNQQRIDTRTKFHSEKQSPLLDSPQSHSHAQPPLPPSFELRIPPLLESKYHSIDAFVATPNDCEICFKFRNIQVVHKPWAQPHQQLQSTSQSSPFPHFNSTSDPLFSSALHQLPTTLYDLNFFNIKTFPGFSTTSQTLSSSSLQSVKFDLSSGKPNDPFGHHLNLSPQLRQQLNSLAPSAVQSILSKFSSHSPSISHSAVPFTAIFAFDSIDDISIPINPHCNPCTPHQTSSSPQPITNPLSTLSSQKYQTPIDNAYGLHIPSSVIRHEMAPFLQLFPFLTFTSSQLSTLFQQPSIFTPYEQFYIMSSRCIPISAVPPSSLVNNAGLLFETLNHTNTAATTHPFFRIGSPGDDLDPSRRGGLIWSRHNDNAMKPAHTANYRSIGLPSRLTDMHKRYVCPLYDDLPDFHRYAGALKNEMGKGYFAQASNPQFNPNTTKEYTDLITTIIYEQYLKRVSDKSPQTTQTTTNTTKTQPSTSTPLDDIDTTNAEKSGQNEDPLANTTPVGLVFDDPYLKALYTQYNHTLRSALQATPGYRDGLFTLDYVPERVFNDAALKKTEVNQNPNFRARMADTASYVVSFPRPHYGLHDANTYGSSYHKLQKFIGAEYLIANQQFTRNVVVDNAVMYPYISSLSSTTDLSFAEAKMEQYEKLALQKKLEFEQQQVLQRQQQQQQQQQQQLVDLPRFPALDGQIDIPPVSMDSTDAQQSQPSPTSTPSLTYSTRYYDTISSPSNTSYPQFPTDIPENQLPIALPLVHGSTFAHHSLHMNRGVNSQIPKLHFVDSPSHWHCLPNCVNIWNWTIAPPLAMLAAFACLIIFGLIYQGQMEATPLTLLPLVILGFFLGSFPWLFCLQRHFELSPRHQDVCGIRKCPCGVPAAACHPKFGSIPTKAMEYYFDAITFSDPFESRVPSVARHFGGLAMAWICVAVYIHWSGIQSLSLTAIFVPMYCLLSLQLLFFRHRVASVGFMEFVPTVLFMISAGVLHGALAAPDNTKYNAVAIFAPFLIFPAAAFITGFIWIWSFMCCNDDCCDANSSECVIFWLSFICFAIFGFWIAFLALLLQDLIRPGSWYVPPYFAVHTVTYIAFVVQFVFIFVSRDETKEEPKLALPSSHTIHDGDAPFSPDLFDTWDFYANHATNEEQQQFEMYTPGHDAMSRI